MQDLDRRNYGPFSSLAFLFMVLLIIGTACSQEEEKGASEKDEKEVRSDTVVSEEGVLKDTPRVPSEEHDKAIPPSPPTLREKLPGKKEYSSAEKRKMAFFQYLYPIVLAENFKTLEERAFVEKVRQRVLNGDSLPDSSLTHLEALGAKYRVDRKRLPSKDGIEELYRKVDIIPAELALIQAANESSWGRSRFAKEGNNLFGEWCFTEGCGIVPKRRSAGSKHEVAAYPNVQFSVRSYILNLNSHPAYKELRIIRDRMRKRGERPSGYAMAQGLSKYAGIGHEYVKILRRMMVTNQDLLEAVDPVPNFFLERRGDPEEEEGGSA